MYRSCIFCSALLGSNESIERFPVGRSLAFDAAKGRLWAVCPRCARWNLAPIEERWEAIEDAERLFRDTRMRAQSENIGLAKLRDGTRLVRVGQALPGEMAVWRYGEALVRRNRRMLIRTVPLTLAGLGIMGVSLSVGLGAYAVWLSAESLAKGTAAAAWRRAVVLEARDADGSPVRVQRRHLVHARLGADGDQVELRLPPLPRDRRFLDAGPRPLVLRGGEARTALGRAMVDVNADGATHRSIGHALAAIQAAGSPAEMLLSAGRQELLLDGARARPPRITQQAFWAEQFEEFVKPRPAEINARDEARRPNSAIALALEMALHEETERRALEGELAMLEGMWREAEEIAAIADRLPDLPAPEPPRMIAPG